MGPVSGWREVEIYGTFIRLTGELEVIGAERLSDSINRFGAFLQVRNSRAEPLSTNYPVLSRLEPRVTIAKSGVILVSPLEEVPDGNSAMWRETVPYAASINTSAISLVGRRPPVAGERPPGPPRAPSRGLPAGHQPVGPLDHRDHQRDPRSAARLRPPEPRLDPVVLPALEGASQSHRVVVLATGKGRHRAQMSLRSHLAAGARGRASPCSDVAPQSLRSVVGRQGTGVTMLSLTAPSFAPPDCRARSGAVKFAGRRPSPVALRPLCRSPSLGRSGVRRSATRERQAWHGLNAGLRLGTQPRRGLRHKACMAAGDGRHPANLGAPEERDNLLARTRERTSLGVVPPLPWRQHHQAMGPRGGPALRPLRALSRGWRGSGARRRRSRSPCRRRR